MFHEQIIKRIPGVPVRSKKEGQGYIKSLKDKQKFELLDLLERQNKLLENKRFVERLPDKGEKILKFRMNILTEIEHRNEVESAAKLLSRLNIAAEGKKAMNVLEWTGQRDENHHRVDKVVELDSDDDEPNPMKILAQPTGSGTHQKRILILPTDESLIRPEDLENIEPMKNKISSCADRIERISDIVENPSSTAATRESFKPFKTTRSNVHDPNKEKMRKKGKNWEATAATPPLTIYGAVKILDLRESLRLHREQNEKLREIEKKRAIEKLMRRVAENCIGDAPANVGNYRNCENNSDSSSSTEDEADEEHEVRDDDEDHDKENTVVVYTVEDALEGV